MIKRRSFLTALGGAATWPLVAQAQQQPALPVIGFLSTGSPRTFAHFVTAFREGLQSQGLAHGRDVWVEERWAEGHYDELHKHAAAFTELKVALIAATGGVVSAQAALKATTTIPIVFVVGFDPVKLGLVASMPNPGGNATGVSIVTTELASKRLQLLKDMFPAVTKVAVLVNPGSVTTGIEIKDIEAAAEMMKLGIVKLEAAAEKDLEPAFSRASTQNAGALLVQADPFFNLRRAQLIALAARHSLPAIYPFKIYVEAGGLMSYGAELPWAYSQAGAYAARILKGGKATDLPVVEPASFELFINLKTAATLGITVPPMLAAIAQTISEKDEPKSSQ